MQGMKILKRHAVEVVDRRLDSFRVVVVAGARQVGKSTLAHMVLERRRGTYVTLDDPLTLSQAVEDPDGLVARGEGLTVIDEVQRAPDVLRAVKLAVDRDPTPGRFLLTGSANLLGLRPVTESLAGRAIYLDLPPLSWSEIVGAPRSGVLDAAFAARSAEELAATIGPTAASAAEGARARALAGGMPEVHALGADERRAWYDSYRRTFLERDLRQLSDISNVPEFSRLTNLALLRTGSLLNTSQLASDAKVSHTTAGRYLGLLEVAYQVRFLQPYFPNVGKRLVKSPKLFAVDCGAAAWAANAWDWRAAMASGRDGALLESFAVGDIIACDGLTGASRYHFWRTAAGAEVDLVVERGDRIVAVEVKASHSLGHRDLSGLRALQTDTGERFQFGVLAYLGDEVRVLGDRLIAMPLASLLGVPE